MLECPQMNQRKLIHAGWTNYNSKGLSLYEAPEFRVRNSILLEEEIKELEYTKKKNRSSKNSYIKKRN